MHHIHLFYATYDGHTRRIVKRLALKLNELGVEVCVHDLGHCQSNQNHPPLLSRRSSEGAKTDAGGSNSLCDFGEGAAPQSRNTDKNSVYDMLRIPPDAIVAVIAPIRYGWHLPSATRFLKLFQREKLTNPLAIISVNLTARKPGKDTAQGNPYLRRWLKRLRLKPDLALAIAGNLDYPRYNLFDRVTIQLIMTITGGPTNPRVAVDFTPWDKVDALAAQIAELK